MGWTRKTGSSYDSANITAIFPRFSEILRRFSQILPRFPRFFLDFQGLCPDLQHITRRTPASYTTTSGRSWLLCSFPWNSYGAGFCSSVLVFFCIGCRDTFRSVLHLFLAKIVMLNPFLLQVRFGTSDCPGALLLLRNVERDWESLFLLFQLEASARFALGMAMARVHFAVNSVFVVSKFLLQEVSWCGRQV